MAARPAVPQFGDALTASLAAYPAPLLPPPSTSNLTGVVDGPGSVALSRHWMAVQGAHLSASPQSAIYEPGSCLGDKTVLSRQRASSPVSPARERSMGPALLQQTGVRESSKLPCAASQQGLPAASAASVTMARPPGMTPPGGHGGGGPILIEPLCASRPVGLSSPRVMHRLSPRAVQPGSACFSPLGPAPATSVGLAVSAQPRRSCSPVRLSSAPIRCASPLRVASPVRGAGSPEVWAISSITTPRALRPVLVTTKRGGSALLAASVPSVAVSLQVSPGSWRTARDCGTTPRQAKLSPLCVHDSQDLTYTL